MRAGTVLLCLAFGLIGACATPAPRWPWVKSDGETPIPVCTGDHKSCTGPDVTTNLSLASSFCRRVHNHYESAGFSSDGAKMTIATVGTLSGAVFAPLGKGSATKAWAGLSGSTNALQAGLDQSFSTTVMLKSQAAVSQAFGANASLVLGSGTNDEKVQRIIVMAAKCAMAAEDGQLNMLRSAINAPAAASTVAATK